MQKQTLLYTAFTLLLILAVLDFIAITHHLYFTLWWFDNVMHFLGGLSLGFLSLYIFYDSKSTLVAFLFVMLLSVGWEVFEYVNGITQSTESYPLDVMHDLISDALGVLSAIFIVRRSRGSS